MIALGITVATGAFFNPRAGILFVEEEMGNSKAPVSEEKIDSRGKTELFWLQVFSSSLQKPGYALHAGSPRPGYSSLPEIPPDLS